MTKKDILKSIISAAIASDAGKGKGYRYNSNIPWIMIALDNGYRHKIDYILRAIHKINSVPKCGINYYVSTIIPDQNGYDSIIVYFNIKVDNENLQISFHTPLEKAKKTELLQLMGSGRKTHWKKSISFDNFLIKSEKILNIKIFNDSNSNKPKRKQARHFNRNN